MPLGPSPPIPRVHIDNVPLPVCTDTTYLGVLVTSDLRWSKHTQTVTAKALRLIAQLRKAIPTPSPTIVQHIYNSLVRPLTEYANVIWRPTLAKDIALLEQVQHRATKWGKLRPCPYETRLQALGLIPITDRQDCIDRGTVSSCSSTLAVYSSSPGRDR